MIINNYLNLLSFFNLGKRYLRTQRADEQAIRRKKAEFYAQAWEDAAAQTGSTIESLGAGIFKITNGVHSILVYQQHTQLVDSVTERLIVDRAITNKLLAKINVPIPRYLHLKDLDIFAAKSFMSEIDRPLVVKPASGTGGGGRRNYQRHRNTPSISSARLVQSVLPGNCDRRTGQR